MKLYFFRHGQAESGIGKSDFDRELTDKGRERTRASAHVLKSLDMLPLRLYSSPLTRARQTADILADVLGLSVAVHEELGPGFNLARARALAGDGGDDVMFVGHEPTFSMVVGELIGGGNVVMKKGGLARVDVYSWQPRHAELVWHIAPKVFDALGGEG